MEKCNAFVYFILLLFFGIYLDSDKDLPVNIKTLKIFINDNLFNTWIILMSLLFLFDEI